MSVPVFLPFSDAVMAALASRSHEWMEWEIRECDETATRLESRDAAMHPEGTETKALAVFVSLSLPARDPQTMRHASLRCEPARDSPSKRVSDLFKAASRAEMPLFHFGDWRQGTSGSKANDYEHDLTSDPRKLLAAVRSELSGQGPWSFDGSLRVFRVKNSRGLIASFSETEITVKLGARTLFSGPRFDVRALRQKLAGG